jgi:arylsulfatase A-like enzyme
MERPNVVLITVDQWRGDALGSAGHPFASTPHLDQLAGSGVRFDRAYAATPSCIPARASLYTGLSQTSTRRVGYRDGESWNYPVTIASEFTSAGFQTQAIGKLHVYPERSQMGFQNVILHDSYLHFARKKPRDLTLVDDYLVWLRERTGDPRADYFDNGVNCNSQIARPWDKDESLHPTTWLVTEAIDFLRRRDPSKPFFLYLGFHRPHPPYDPPNWAFEQYLDIEMPDPPVGRWAHDVLGPYNDGWRADPTVAQLSGPQLRRARAGYFGHITHIDLQINRLLEVFDEYGLRFNTVFAFVSDHGEMLGDHNAYRKSLPYEGSAHIPWIVTGPGIPSGVVCQDNVVELRDVMPTLLRTAGVPLPNGLDGADALSVVRDSGAAWRTHLHGEHTFADQSVHYICDDTWKYVWWSGTGREQLFDLKSDPQELKDLHEPLLVEDYRRKLVAALANRPEGFVEGEKLVCGKKIGPILPSPDGLDLPSTR